MQTYRKVITDFPLICHYHCHSFELSFANNFGFPILYNCLGLIYVAIYDEDVSAKGLLLQPASYAVGQKDTLLNLKVFAEWISTALVESFVIFAMLYWGVTVLPVFSTVDGVTVDNPMGLWEMGSAFISVWVLVANYRMALYEVHVGTTTSDTIHHSHRFISLHFISPSTVNTAHIFT